MKLLGTFQNSPLRYPGSKSRRAVRLLRLTDQSKTHFCEPFAGGLGFLLKARRERLFKTYSANDADPQVYNFWKVLQNHSELLLSNLWKNYDRHGYGDSDLFNKSKEDLSSENEITRAAAFFTITRWSVRGDLRSKMLVTKKGGDGISPNMISRLSLFSDLLQGVNLTNLDYRELDIPRNSFVFIDPPYENKKLTFNYEHGIDFTEFRDWADDLPGSWLITINDSDTTNELFSGYDRIVYEYKRTFPVVLHSKAGALDCAHGSEIMVVNFHSRTREAFLRSFQWKLRKAQPSSKAS